MERNVTPKTENTKTEKFIPTRPQPKGMHDNESDIVEICNASWTLSQKLIFIVNVFVISVAVLLAVCAYYEYSNVLMDNGTNLSLSNGALQVEDPFAKMLHCVNKLLKTKIHHYGQYWILENYIIGQLYKNCSCARQTTYVTHIRDLNVFQNLPELALRWNAPISVALFAPATDFELYLAAMQYVRNCLSHSKYVKEAISFNIIIPHQHLPNYIPHGKDIESWNFNCSKSALHLQFPYKKTYAFKQRLAYPINILRNVARRAINTHFYLHAEAHYLPARNLSEKYINTLLTSYCSLIRTNNRIKASSCNAIHLREDIMRLMHLLPAQIRNSEIIHSVIPMEVKTDCAIPEGTNALKMALRRGDVSMMHSSHYYFFGNPNVPYYDERIYWLEDLPNQLQTYILCLLDFKWTALSDHILWIYANQTELNYTTISAFTPSAQYLNKSILKLEYENIYGNMLANECQKCYNMDDTCTALTVLEEF